MRNVVTGCEKCRELLGERSKIIHTNDQMKTHLLKNVCVFDLELDLQRSEISSSDKGKRVVLLDRLLHQV